jgi:hypothetical protein
MWGKEYQESIEGFEFLLTLTLTITTRNLPSLRLPSNPTQMDSRIFVLYTIVGSCS